MQLKVKTVLNAIQHFPGFVFHDVRLLDERNGQPRLEVTIVPHAGRPVLCSHCRQSAPGLGVFDVENTAELAAVKDETTFHNFGFFVRKL